MRLIGITGPARSGKDTAGQHLKTAHSYAVDSFAAPLRSFVADLLGISLRELEAVKDTHFSGFDKTPRKMMQITGTECGRELIQPDLWLASLQIRINKLQCKAKNIVITDVRFENEAEMIRSNGGTIWHIHSQGASYVNPHISEQGVDVDPKLDKLIMNMGSIQRLHKTIDSQLERNA